MSNGTQTHSTWPHYRFGLLVTGETEETHLPKLFRCLQAIGPGTCSFEVIKRFGQRDPPYFDKKGPS